jgi:hypothetical protein
MTESKDRRLKEVRCNIVECIRQLIKKMLLAHLAKYTLCDFFLRRCVESMNNEQVLEDLAGEPDLSLLQHFDKPGQMRRLEELFSKTMKTLGISKEKLKRRAEFNFDLWPRHAEMAGVMETRPGARRVAVPAG